MRKVLAVQLPAPCPLACSFCRTPNHGDGNPEQIMRSVARLIGQYEEVYVTSNGETGLSPIFNDLLALVHQHSKQIAILCATDRSVVPGLSRVEISLNQFTEPLALRAIKKAHELGIPTVLSIVDQGQPIDCEALALKHGIDGVLVRACQKEGRSRSQQGVSRFFKKVGAQLGMFPAIAYRELVSIPQGFDAICLNHEGHEVSFLGSPAS